MSLGRQYLRPPELLAGVFFEQAAYGFVQWVKVAETERETFWEAEGYEVRGEPIIPAASKTRLVRQDVASQHNRDFYLRMILEVNDALAGDLTKPRLYSKFTIEGFRSGMESFLRERAIGFDGRGIVTGSRVPFATFFLPDPPPPPALPQTKARRRGIILFGVKQTRSNKNQFAKFRVPHR